MSPRTSTDELLVAGCGGIRILDSATGEVHWHADLSQLSEIGADRRRWVHWYGDGVADEARPVRGTRLVLTTTVAGLVALVDTAGGAEFIAWEPGAHSAYLLPDDRVVVAVSNSPGAFPDDAPRGAPSRLVLHRRGAGGSALHELPCDDAHGVWWDPRKEILWALGWDRLIALSCAGDRLAPVATHLLPDGATAGRCHGGHDLVFDPTTGSLLVTTVRGAWSFAADRFTAIPSLAGRHMKGISPRPGDGLLAWVQADPDQLAIGTGIHIADGRFLALDAAPYKVRWVARDGDGRFR